MASSGPKQQQSELQDIQSQLSKVVEARQQLEAQQQENLSVQKEFKNLGQDASIYKLVGQVLLKQERIEATAAVNGRLEFIDREIKRTEKQIQDLQSNAQRIQEEASRATR